jgi:D-glycero-alpha-D-manno-heptose-7-phosphate kinase
LIITRSPLRISLGGGGTDLASYYREHTGFVISAAIDKYVYIILHESFSEGIMLKYSRMESVSAVESIQHPIVREALKLLCPDTRQLEIASMADIPAGTGMGSSGSFTTALLKALYALVRKSATPRELAEQACHIEIDLLDEPIGKQDQYIAAYGGITCFTFETDGYVKSEPLKIPPAALANLEDNLLLFFTGFTRSASHILQDQHKRSQEKDLSMIENLHFVKQLGLESKTAFEQGDLRKFADIMHVHWEHKKKRSQGMSNPAIDEYYELARANGALGGKLIGAGGGGFLMFYTEEKTKLRAAMAKTALREVRMRFDLEGTQVTARS